MPPFSPEPSIAMLERETRWQYGSVPSAIGGQPLVPVSQRLVHGEFGLRTDSGYAFHYLKGKGITVERTGDADPDELELWLHGSVYAAVACMNGLYPIHASAIALGGTVHAFT